MTYEIKLYWELGDADLAGLYAVGRKEKVLETVGYDVSVNEDLFHIFARQAEVFGAVYNQNDVPAGFFYLNSFEGATARLHFCFFKAGRPDRFKIGRQVLKWCFEAFEFKALMGIVPINNIHAVKYAEEIGGQRLGEIPGICWLEKLKQSVNGVQFIFHPFKEENYGRV